MIQVKTPEDVVKHLKMWSENWKCVQTTEDVISREECVLVVKHSERHIKLLMFDYMTCGLCKY